MIHKPKKRGRPPKKEPSYYMKRKAERERQERERQEPSAYMKGKLGRERYERERIERIEKAQRDFDARTQRSKAAEPKISEWTNNLSWQSKPPPPEFIYMIINGNPIKCRLMRMHNMPVYLPDIDELP